MMSVLTRTAAAVLAATAAISGPGAIAAHAADGNAPVQAATATQLRDTEPRPSCNDNNNTVPCWEYQTWYWTYDNCHRAGDGQVSSSQGKYDKHVCVLTSNGVGVGLWLHKLYN
jgi:hypothetical protein